MSSGGLNRLMRKKKSSATKRNGQNPLKKKRIEKNKSEGFGCLAQFCVLQPAKPKAISGRRGAPHATQTIHTDVQNSG